MKPESLIEAIQIFAKYEPNCISMSAEHDTLWVGPYVKDIRREDIKRLEELGWIIDDSVERFFIYP